MARKEEDLDRMLDQIPARSQFWTTVVITIWGPVALAGLAISLIAFGDGAVSDGFVTAVFATSVLPVVLAAAIQESHVSSVLQRGHGAFLRERLKARMLSDRALARAAERLGFDPQPTIVARRLVWGTGLLAIVALIVLALFVRVDRV